MNCLDHLLPFIDNGGRRSYIERRCNSKIIARIPERRTYKERRINYDRRKTHSVRMFPVQERRMKRAKMAHRSKIAAKDI